MISQSSQSSTDKANQSRSRQIKHCEELSIRPGSLNPLHIKVAHIDIFVHVTPPAIEEVTKPIDTSGRVKHNHQIEYQMEP